MPSLHVAWAVWVSVALMRARAHRGGTALGALHLGVTIAVVLTTANHYVLDILAGAAVVALAVLVEESRRRVSRLYSSGRPPNDSFTDPPADLTAGEPPIPARMAQ